MMMEVPLQVTTTNNNIMGYNNNINNNNINGGSSRVDNNLNIIKVSTSSSSLSTSSLVSSGSSPTTKSLSSSSSSPPQNGIDSMNLLSNSSGKIPLAMNMVDASTGNGNCNGNGTGYQTCTQPNHEAWWGTKPEQPLSEFYNRSYKCKKCYIRQQTESKRMRQQSTPSSSSSNGQPPSPTLPFNININHVNNNTNTNHNLNLSSSSIPIPFQNNNINNNVNNNFNGQQTNTTTKSTSKKIKKQQKYQQQPLQQQQINNHDSSSIGAKASIQVISEYIEQLSPNDRIEYFHKINEQFKPFINFNNDDQIKGCISGSIDQTSYIVKIDGSLSDVGGGLYTEVTVEGVKFKGLLFEEQPLNHSLTTPMIPEYLDGIVPQQPHKAPLTPNPIITHPNPNFNTAEMNVLLQQSQLLSDSEHQHQNRRHPNSILPTTSLIVDDGSDQDDDDDGKLLPNSLHMLQERVFGKKTCMDNGPIKKRKKDEKEIAAINSLVSTKSLILSQSSSLIPSTSSSSNNNSIVKKDKQQKLQQQSTTSIKSSIDQNDDESGHVEVGGGEYDVA